MSATGRGAAAAGPASLGPPYTLFLERRRVDLVRHAP